MSFWSETLVACPLDLFPPLSTGQHNLPLRTHTRLRVLFVSHIYVCIRVGACVYQLTDIVRTWRRDKNRTAALDISVKREPEVHVP